MCTSPSTEIHSLPSAPLTNCAARSVAADATAGGSVDLRSSPLRIDDSILLAIFSFTVVPRDPDRNNSPSDPSASILPTSAAIEIPSAPADGVNFTVSTALPPTNLLTTSRPNALTQAQRS